jgi:hypothetical protein
LLTDQPESTYGDDQEIEEELGNALLEILPADGSTIGNQAARQALSEQVGREIDEVMAAAGWSAQAARGGRSWAWPHSLAQIDCGNWDPGGFRGVCGEAGLGLRATGS